MDATSFLVRDAHGVADRVEWFSRGIIALTRAGALYLPNTKVFLLNEVEATVTLTTSSPPKFLINQVTPTGKHVTVRERSSFVELPDDKYKPRRFDPRTGAISISFYDYGTDINQDLEQRLIIRHRLEKKDPNAAVSEPIKPIIYYVDNGAPKAIQTPSSRGQAGGIRHSRRQVLRMPSRSGYFPMPIRWIYVTTSSIGAPPRVAGRSAIALSIRAQARSLRAT
ncbi:MAG: DUF5117 domain-containing protein [Pyrinomonadaceae bacterium]